MSYFTRNLILASVLATVFTATVQAESSYRAATSAPGATSLSRAEVIADTNLWIRAGVDKYVDQVQYHADTTQYERALAEYHRLRNGPAYAAEVARVEAQRGETPVTRLSQRGAAN